MSTAAAQVIALIGVTPPVVQLWMLRREEAIITRGGTGRRDQAHESPRSRPGSQTRGDPTSLLGMISCGIEACEHRWRLGAPRSGRYSARHSAVGLLLWLGGWRAPRLPPRGAPSPRRRCAAGEDESRSVESARPKRCWGRAGEAA